MTFSDLSSWDLELIRSHAIDLFKFHKNIDDRGVALIKAVIIYINAKAYSTSITGLELENVLVSKLIVKKYDTPTNIIENLFKIFKSENINIFKDPSKISTWSTPSKSWYHTEYAYKKPWQY